MNVGELLEILSKEDKLKPIGLCIELDHETVEDLGNPILVELYHDIVIINCPLTK